eukprot:6228141-Prymnesium_polylepis.1
MAADWDVVPRAGCLLRWLFVGRGNPVGQIPKSPERWLFVALAVLPVRHADAEGRGTTHYSNTTATTAIAATDATDATTATTSSLLLLCLLPLLTTYCYYLLRLLTATT